MYKTKGGYIKTVHEVEVHTMGDNGISGVFTLFPKKELDGMEIALQHTKRERGELDLTLEEFYDEYMCKLQLLIPQMLEK